jgi:hypothetical protein
MSAGADRYSLVVKGGTLVIPGVGRVCADVGIRGGAIVALGDDLASRADAVFDATGKIVLPGIFDPHAHIGNERAYDEEAETETRAAVLGGVTTIGIFLRSLEESYLKHLPAFRQAMDERSYVDSVFHPQIFTEEQIAEIPIYAEQFGIRSFKFYMSGMPGIVKSITDDVLLHGSARSQAWVPTPSPASIARPACSSTLPAGSCRRRRTERSPTGSTRTRPMRRRWRSRRRSISPRWPAPISMSCTCRAGRGSRSCAMRGGRA